VPAEVFTDEQAAEATRLAAQFIDRAAELIRP
jgi:hypothetical protein